MITTTLAATLLLQPQSPLIFSTKELFRDEYETPVTRVHVTVKGKKHWLKDVVGTFSESGPNSTTEGFPKTTDSSGTYWFAGAGGQIYVQTTPQYIVIKERWIQETGDQEDVSPYGPWQTLRLFDRSGTPLEKYNPSKVTGTYTGKFDGKSHTIKITNSASGMTFSQTINNKNPMSMPMHLENAFTGMYWLQNPKPNPEVAQIYAATVQFKSVNKKTTLTLTQFGDSFTFTKK